MKTKTTFIAALAAAVLTAGVGTAVILNKANPVNADTPVSIGTLAQLKTYFDGAGTNCGNSATLTADIDLNGAYVSGMAGEFTATFNGNGHKLYNGAVGATTSLFNIIGASGIVKNLTYDVTVTGAVVRPLSYLNNGTIQDCTAVIRTGAASVNNVAAYAYLAGSGAYTNLYTDWVVNHSGADWLCSVYRDQSSTKVTGSYYTKNGSQASSIANFQADGMTESADVNYLNPSSSSLSTTISGTAAQVIEAFGATNTSVEAVSANTGVATVSGTSITGYTVTGVAAGSTTVTFMVVSARGTFSVATPVTVVASAPVTAVSVAASGSVYEGKTLALTATLTGTEYSSIAWSSDAESHATVVGSGTSATVTGVAAGTANITVSVVSTSGTFTGTCAVTVNASVYLPVYLFVSKTTHDTTDYWSQAYLFAYGDLGDNTPITMTKVQENGKDVILRAANTTNGGAIDTWQVWLAKIDITGKTISYSNTYFQVNNSSSGRWGSGYQVTSSSGAVVFLGYKAADAYAKASYTPADVASGLTYCASSIYSSSWRDVNSSICYLASDAAYANVVTNGYEQLATGPKAFVDIVDDSTTAYTATLGETIAMLQAKHAAGSGTAYNAGILAGTDYLPWILVSVAGIVAVGGFFFLLKKKHARA
ncbi:MAG: Bacterial Ig-like domain (group 2) [Tenericutes bacterium ADurb.BinA155]|nr:MAG: Bacterial Ig-like domain (group 2) [Tenericutes bacterium ADurb.BinA155]